MPSKEQKTVNSRGETILLAAKGRHDPCVLPRAVPNVEAMLALVIADHMLEFATCQPVGLPSTGWLALCTMVSSVPAWDGAVDNATGGMP